MSSIGSLSGTAGINGLPFSSATQYYGMVGQASGLAITAGHSVGYSMLSGGDYLTLNTWDAADGTTNMTCAEISDDGAVYFSFS